MPPMLVTSGGVVLPTIGKTENKIKDAVTVAGSQ
jgi:hypothetical protein